jgi:tRNA-dihydrouridine synthase
MKIARLTLENNVILAPMAGISDLPYRQIMKRFGAGLVFTEMVSANGLIRAGKRTRELLRSAPDERPLGIQLFGDEPAVLAEAATLVRGDGELIDLNLGCPVNKVVSSGAGSALLRYPAKVARVVAAVRRSTDLPLTVKIRSGWDDSSINYRDRPHRRRRRGRCRHSPPPHSQHGVQRQRRLGGDRPPQEGAAGAGDRQRRHLLRRRRPGDARADRLRRHHDRPRRLRQPLADP